MKQAELTHQHPDSCIVMFARAPVKGQVKTRLIPALGEQGALDMHVQLMNRQMAVLRTLKAQVQIRHRIHYLRTESGLDLHRCATRTEVLAKLLILEYLQTIPLRIEKGNLEPLACIISIWQE